MQEQLFDWGYVEWFDDQIESINIGISHIYPHTRQKPHIHHENAQWVYVLEGQGIYGINAKTVFLKKGDWIFLPFNAEHFTINEEDQELVDFVISCSRQTQIYPFHKMWEYEYVSDEEDILVAIQALNLTQTSPKSIPYLIINNNMSILYQNLPLNSASPFYDPQSALQKQTLLTKESKLIKKIPLQIEKKIQGYILCDLSLISQQNMTVSSCSSINKFLQELKNSIESFCHFISIRRKLKEQTQNLIKNEKNIEQLENDLLEERAKSNHLKINHHFLFNTLNYMANVALEKDNLDLYEAIILLSKMFRYTSQNKNELISLREELENLEAYLTLQKLRYQDTMSVFYDIDYSVLNESIPVNSLQPIVENAFTHGFMNFDGRKEIFISIKNINKNIEIHLENNGLLLDMNSIKNVNNQIQKESDHGLSLIYRNFKWHYKNHFSIQIYTHNNLTGVKIIIFRNHKEP